MSGMVTSVSALATKLKTLLEQAEQYPPAPQRLLDEIAETRVLHNEAKAANKAINGAQAKLNEQRGRVEELETRLGRANEDARKMQSTFRERRKRGQSTYDALQDANKASTVAEGLLKEFKEATRVFTNMSDNLKSKAPPTPTTSSPTKCDISLSTPATLQAAPKPGMLPPVQTSMHIDSSFDDGNLIDDIAATTTQNAPPPATIQSPMAVSGLNKLGNTPIGDSNTLGERPQKRRKIQRRMSL